MNIELKRYQEIAVEGLVNSVKGLLGKEGMKKVCVFQAPTGSGKTIMTAKFIEELIRELPDEDICFVWVTVGKGDLHLQSKHSLERIYGGAPRVSLVEEEFTGGRERIVKNEIVVVNWEKLRTKDRSTKEWKNVLMKDGEKINFRDVLAKTREQRKIILIIDESHIGATAERTNELRDEINADVILEMSATPKIQPDPKDLTRGLAGFVFVEPKDVIDAGIIKKELIINEKIDKIAKSESDSQEVVLESAYQKRLELKKLLKAEGSNINPLILIQIPTAEAGKDKIEAVKEFLSRKGITEKNGKLAIWLAEQKSETLDWVAEPDNEIEFLIFKQAIDTGWDCPRAHILVKFRESHSETFEIQTVGRILRMPELKHYPSEPLNIGYIYTNVQSIIVKKEEYNPNIIKHLKGSRKDCYKDIKLTSYYRSRVDYGDVTSSFTPAFSEVANKEFGIKEDYALIDKNFKRLKAKGLHLDVRKYQQEIIRDAQIDAYGFDELEGKINAEQTAKLIIAGNDLQAMFEQIIQNNLGSFRNIKRSVPAVKTAIYVWFRKYLGSRDWDEEALMVQKIFVHNGNREVFERILSKAIEEYRGVREKEMLKRVEGSEQFYDFEIPKESFYNQHTDETVNVKKYVYEPCYLNVDRTNPEREFEKFLETNAKHIIWWWKNGENKKDYFGIKYEYPKGVVHTFYSDYLVEFSDGRIGIFETKDHRDQDGSTFTKAKSEALQRYLKGQNKKGKELFGGIVIQVNGTWLRNLQQAYNWEKCLRNDWSEWEEVKL
ncbi:MAG: DEAD/DEAH box helicase family protein [Candidatus Omnitrophica bacterium]|nr:DEAD/DEAH box helicase family protein [Candidatus Omnitrophota bacterium]